MDHFQLPSVDYSPCLDFNNYNHQLYFQVAIDNQLVMVIAIHCLDFCQAIHGGNLSPRGFIPSLIQRGFLSEKSRRQAKDLHERGGHGWCVSIYVFLGQQLYQKWIVEMWRIFGWTIMILGLDQLDHEHIEAFSMNFWILPMMMVSLGTGLKQRSRWFSAAEEFTMTLLALLGRWWGLVHQNMGRFRVSGVPQQKMVSKKTIEPDDWEVLWFMETINVFLGQRPDNLSDHLSRSKSCGSNSPETTIFQ